MKKLLGVLVFLVILVLGTYYGMGWITERTFKTNVDFINQNNNIKLDLKSYERGWFRAKAFLVAHIHVMGYDLKNTNGGVTHIPDADYQVDVPLIIVHGPVIFSDATPRFGLGYARSRLDVPKDYTVLFSKLFTEDSSRPKLLVNMFVSYLNQSNIQITLPDFKLTSKKDGTELNWLGFVFNIDVSSGLRRIAGDVQFSGLNYQQKDGAALVIGPITTDYELKHNDNDLYLGDATANLSDVKVSQAGSDTTELKGLVLHSRNGVQDGLFRSGVDVTLNSLLSNKIFYGPGLLSMAIKNLDAKVMADINRQLNQNSVATPQQVLLMLLPELPKLLAKKAAFEITKMSFVVPEGTVEGHLTLAFLDNLNGNPFAMLQSLQGDGTIKVPAAFFKNIIKKSIPAAGLVVDDVMQSADELAQKKIDALLRAKTLVLQGSDYLMEVRLLKGELTVNGMPFNASMLAY